MDPNKRIRQAVEEARQVLGRFIPPGPRDCDEAVNEITEALDNVEVDQALEAKENGDNGDEQNEGRRTAGRGGEKAQPAQD